MKRRKGTLILSMAGGALLALGGRAFAEAVPQQEQYPCWEERLVRDGGEEEGRSSSAPCPPPPSCSVSPDCNGNGIDDRCDVNCLNTGKFCSGSQAIYDECTRTVYCGDLPDCNNNNKPDECDLAGNDCNGNGVPDECDIGSGFSADLNGNGVPDECEDCDGDGIPDDLEDNPFDQDCDSDGICNGFEVPDCNGNNVPDGCETAPSTATFAFNSGRLAPLDWMTEHQAVFYSAPEATGDVTLSFEAVGDLDSDIFPESVRVHLYPYVAGCGDNYQGWCTIGNVFSQQGEGSACPGTVDVDTLPVSLAVYNAILAATGGVLEIWMDPSINVDVCAGSYIAATASYETAVDCNANGIPDSCDIADETSEDCNGNGVPDECDIAGGFSPDCDDNGVPDECDPNCNGDGEPDACEADVAEQDCNSNGICNADEIAGCAGDPACGDCDANGLTDECDILIADGGLCDPSVRSDCSADCQNADPSEPGHGVPDVCEADCDGNLIPDFCDIRDCPSGDFFCGDCNANSVPDGCDVDPSDPDGDGDVSADCQPVGDIGNGIPDECDIDPLDPDGDGYVSDNCNGNTVPDECEPDCNGNGVTDDCDISSGSSQDCDSSNVPDECEASAEPAGSRYVEVTPGGFSVLGQWLDPAESYTLKIEPYPDGFNACNSHWVLNGGHLTDDPAQAHAMTPDAWCTQYVHDEIIIPSGTYTVIAEANGQEVLQWNVITNLYCDVDGDGSVDISDITGIVQCFQWQFTETRTLQSCDQSPPLNGCAAPDGLINIDDILACVDVTFNGKVYSCPDPCFTGPLPPAAPPAATGALATSETPHSIDPGDTVEVDVYVAGTADLRAYEVSVDITGGSRGALILVNAFIDETRTDYAFYGEATPTHSGIDLSGGRIANLLETGGVNALTDVYAGTFVFQASSSADGTFTATALIQDTKLRTSNNTAVGIATTTSTTISVTGGFIPPQE